MLRRDRRGFLGAIPAVSMVYGESEFLDRCSS
jgi:hypothetical protein